MAFYSRNNILGPHCSIYLSNLAPTVMEANLFKLFNTIGIISSARVVRNEKGESQGRAYVNFMEPVHAEKALKTMNGVELEGKPIRIRRKKKETNLFVRNIPKEKCDKAQLLKLFEPYGRVASCRIMFDKKGKSMGYGYVRFQNQEGADKAIDASMSDEGIEFEGHKIEVNYYQTWKERTHEMKMNEHFFTCVHLKGYPATYGEDEISALFEDLKICPAKIDIAKKDDGSSKAYCFVEFDKHEDAEKALELNETEHEGNKLNCNRLMSNFERQQSQRKQYLDQKRETHNQYKGRNLYVKNFPNDWDEEQLKKTFEEHGKVTSTKVMRNSKRQSKGFGFVCFEDKAAANKAMKALNKTKFGDKTLCVNMAELKESRQKRLWGPNYNQEKQQRGGPQYGGYAAPMYHPGPYAQPWGYEGGGGGYRRGGRGGNRRGGRGGGYRGRYRKPGNFVPMQPTQWMPMNMYQPMMHGMGVARR